MAQLEEKRKTLNNQKVEILDAKVVANYGDPGLDEDYYFDILSRYVIVKIESTDRVLTKDKWFRMLAVVKRPQHLWVSVEGGVKTPTIQQRSDHYGNINVGLANSFGTNAIPRINEPYTLGETIKIRRLPKPLVYTNDTMFQSPFTVWDSTTFTYGSWHTQGSTLPYFAGNTTRLTGLTQKTIDPIAEAQGYFNFYLSKYQYEAMMLNSNVQNQSTTNILTSIFDGSWRGDTQIFTANGGYLFQGDTIFCLMSTVEFEDVNAGNKQRVSTTECIPLVVTTPQSFPTPRSRSPGTIAYNPTYSTINR